MKKYIFVLGRDPELSYAELISYFKNFNYKYKLEYYENILEDRNGELIEKHIACLLK